MRGRRDPPVAVEAVRRTKRAQHATRHAGLDADASPAPRSAGSECGVVWTAASEGAPRHVSPKATADVTAFGLAAHAAEVAESSGIAVAIHLDATPPLSCTSDAAATGPVSAATGKIGRSLAEVVETEPRTHPTPADPASNPQPSAGLLAHRSAAAAADLGRRRAEGAVVGVCGQGPMAHFQLSAHGSGARDAAPR